jgi:RNA polymerase sigma-70 factor (ECF subfamily)
VRADLDIHLAAIVGGDAAAFARWLAGAEPVVRATLASFAAAVDVEVILQESLVRTWQVAPRFERDGEPNGLLRLAIRIARNLAISEVRRTKALPVELRDDADALGDDVAPPDPLLRRAIADCHGKLPARPRSALDARLAAVARDDADHASALGMSLNTFLQNVTRARALLADCLKRAGIAVEELV